jgi:hypothetical protein
VEVKGAAVVRAAVDVAAVAKVSAATTAAVVKAAVTVVVLFCLELVLALRSLVLYPPSTRTI